MLLPLLIFFVLVYLFLKKEEKIEKVSPSKSEKGKMKSVFKTANGDSGTNNVLVATDKGEIVNESNIAKIDALTTQISGGLNINEKKVLYKNTDNYLHINGNGDFTGTWIKNPLHLQNNVIMRDGLNIESGRLIVNGRDILNELNTCIKNFDTIKIMNANQNPPDNLIGAMGNGGEYGPQPLRAVPEGTGYHNWKVIKI